MKLSDIAKRMVKVVIIIGLICVVASIIYYRSLGFLPFLFGVILGSIGSIFKIRLIDCTVDKALDMEKKKASKYLALQNTLRLLFSGVVLIIGAIVPQISIWGVVAGTFAFPLAVYTENFRTKTGGD